MILCADVERAEAALRSGRLPCPRCGGCLRAWGRAGVRRVRQLDGSTWAMRPRRARCAGCGATQVLLPADCLPRRGDATEVVGAALVAKASGAGHRRIAADLDRSPSTVRRWLRAARSAGHAERLRTRAVAMTVRVEPDLLATVPVVPGVLAQALTALTAAVVAIRRRFPEIDATPWALINVMAGGRLLAARSPG